VTNDLTPEEEILKWNGVPVVYVRKKLNLDKLQFSQLVASVNKKVVQIRPESQLAALNMLLNKAHLIGEPRLYAFGSALESQAAKVAVHLAAKYCNHCLTARKEMPKLRWFNLGKPNIDKVYRIQEQYELVVISNLSELHVREGKGQRTGGLDAHLDRLTLARDILSVHQESTCLVLVNTADILGFSVKHLGAKPDAVWQFSQSSEIEVV
jgi:hypothetical protein